MKTSKDLLDIIIYPFGLVIFIGISGACLVTYISLRIFGPHGRNKNTKNND